MQDQIHFPGVPKKERVHPMSLSLKDLRTTNPHPLKPVFDRYSRAKVAALVGCHPQYLGDILHGRLSPSAKLESRMRQLAKEIREAEKAEK
jgi:hypothetical protein